MVTAAPTSYPTKEAILAAVATGKLGVDDASKLFAAMEKPAQRLHAKVSEKVAVILSGRVRSFHLKQLAQEAIRDEWHCLMAGKPTFRESRS